MSFWFFAILLHFTVGLALSPPWDARVKSEKRQSPNKKWELQIEYSGRTFFDGWEFFDVPGLSPGSG
jgi:hypothetical protein